MGCQVSTQSKAATLVMPVTPRKSTNTTVAPAVPILKTDAVQFEDVEEESVPVTSTKVTVAIRTQDMDTSSIEQSPKQHKKTPRKNNTAKPINIEVSSDDIPTVETGDGNNTSDTIELGSIRYASDLKSISGTPSNSSSASSSQCSSGRSEKDDGNSIGKIDNSSKQSSLDPASTQRYYLKRMFTNGSDMMIMDHNGQDLYKVDNKTLRISDMKGTTLLSVKEKALAIVPTFKIFQHQKDSTSSRDGNAGDNNNNSEGAAPATEIAVLKKKMDLSKTDYDDLEFHLTLSLPERQRQRQQAGCTGGTKPLQVVIYGDVQFYDYTFTCEDVLFAHVTRQFTRGQVMGQNTYGLEVDTRWCSRDEHVIILAAAVIIDRIAHRGEQPPEEEAHATKLVNTYN